MAVMSAIATARRRRELAGDSRAGSFARSKARKAQLSHVRDHWKVLSVGWAIIALPVLAVSWFLPTDLLQGVALGAAVTSATATVWFWVVQSTGTAPTMMGDQAEQWTAQTLRRLGPGWRLVNRFLLSSDGDIDHVAIGPRGVFVVETKWSATSWEERFNRERLHRATLRVERSARNIKNSLAKRTGMPVHAVLVLWGGGIRTWASDRCVTYAGDVAVVAGHHLREYVRGGPNGSYPPGAVDEVWRAVDAHAKERDKTEGENFVVPVPATTVLIRIGLFTTALCGGLIAMLELLGWFDSTSMTVAFGAVASGVLFVVNRRWAAVRALALGAFAGVAAMTLLVGSAALLSLV